MIIDDKKYPLIFNALKEFTVLGKEESHYTNQQAYGLFNNLVGGNYELMVKHILANEWSQFPVIDLNKEMIKSKYDGIVRFLWQLDKKLLGFLQKSLMPHNIDFITELQKVIVQHYNNYFHDKVILNISSAFIHQLNAGTYIVDSSEKIQIINKMADYFIERSQQDSHRIALTLVKTLLNVEANKDNGLKKLKIFLDNNKTINPNGSKELEAIKEKMKNWDVSRHFTLAEKKMLYASADGMVAKKVEGLFYDLDINIIKSKIKGKKKVTNTIIHSNINSLLSQLPIALGNLESYVGTTCVNESPSIQINILFECGVNPDQIDAMNNLVETIITSPEVVEVKQVAKLIETTLFAAFLDATLSQKEVAVKRVKI